MFKAFWIVSVCGSTVNHTTIYLFPPQNSTPSTGVYINCHKINKRATTQRFFQKRTTLYLQFHNEPKTIPVFLAVKNDVLSVAVAASIG